MEVMNELNVRLEGFAKEQLSRGKGPMSIVHELVRMGHIDQEAARTIVDEARPAVMRQVSRRGRGTFLFGLLILAVPAAIFGGFLYDALILSYGGRFNQGLFDAVMTLVSLPMLLPEIIGIATVMYGWSLMRRSRKSIDPAAQGGPASTGLWWRADPFEWT
jgi:hypothetical protein